MFHLLLIPAGKWAIAHWGASTLAASHTAPIHTAITVGGAHTAAAGAVTKLAATPALSSAAAALHGAAASHAAGVLTQHGANSLAKVAGAQTAKVLAAAAAGGGHAAGASALAPHGLHVLPVHLVSGSALAKVTAVTAGAAGGVAAVSLSPHASLAATKLAKAFGRGFLLQQIKRQRAERVDLRKIKQWFGHQEDPKAHSVRFTAIGKVRGGRFYPVSAPAQGPYSLMQGIYDPKTGELVSGRIVRVTDSLSGSVLRSHRSSGITVYASEEALLPA